MSIKTDIGWCDSTLNIQMGCDGCELWTINDKICYAGIMTEKYKGMKGWPVNFETPTIFPERIKTGIKWPDLRRTIRKEKPFIPQSMPRLIFLNDMGDTFTKSLPLNWLAPFIPEMEASPHIYQILTKRPKRMAKFFQDYGHVPDNFWLGTSITTQRSFDVRYPYLTSINAKTLFFSFEPMMEYVNLESIKGISWVIFGGMSGAKRIELSIENLEKNIYQCNAQNVPVFVKQDSGLYPGTQGRIPDELFIQEFPNG